MPSRAEIARRKRARTEAKTVENRAKEQAVTAPATPAPKPSERKGLQWLLHKKRITPRQFWAGTCYGDLYRAVQLNGMEPLRSCIDFQVTGSGDGVPGLPQAETDLTVSERLTALHVTALRSEPHMIATVAAVCGRQLTPREITTEQAETVEIETTLRLALNLLADHLEHRRAAA